MEAEHVVRASKDSSERVHRRRHETRRFQSNEQIKSQKTEADIVRILQTAIERLILTDRPDMLQPTDQTNG